MLLFKRSIVCLALVLGLSGFARASDYEPQFLGKLVERVRSEAENGETPVVMFDLDDTLINTRERNQRIYRDFAAQADIARKYPLESQELASVRVDQIHYLLSDTLQELGIANADFASEATAFWLGHFFTNEYCALDRPNPGAVRYVNQLLRAGATIVYLTGRDVPRMGEGTAANLRLRGFPLDDARVKLIMKQDPKMDDLVFKISQYGAIAGMGKVVGAFENEPANINSMAAAFPDAISIFLDTIHSPKPDVVREGIHWVRDFYNPAEVEERQAVMEYAN